MRLIFGKERGEPIEAPAIVCFSAPRFRAESVDEIRRCDAEARVVRDPVASAVPEAFVVGSDAGFVRVARCLPGSIFTRHAQPIERVEAVRDVDEIVVALRRERERARPARVDVIGLPRALRRRVIRESAPAAQETEPIVLSALLAGGWLHLGASSVADALSPWAGGDPELPAEQFSRAESKLREALALFRVDVAPGASALDLGAAPGGFTSVLLERGARVIAVDPAPLDARLDGAEGLTAVRGYAQDMALEGVPPLDIITCDVISPPDGVARAVARFAPRLRPGGRAIVTIKLRASKPTARQLCDAKPLFGPLLELVGMRHLHSNRCEVTAVFRR